MTGKGPRRHHVLPQRYQRGFADAQGFVWVFDRRRRRISCENPANIAVQKHFYTIEGSDPLHGASLEQFLANQIEGPFWPTLDRLEGGENPTSADRARISLFAAFLLVRGIAARAFFARVFGNVIASRQDIRWDSGTLDDMFPRSEAGVLMAFLPRNRALQRMVHIGLEAAKHLGTLDTHIMYSPDDEPFMTGDNPLVLVRMVDSGEPASVSAMSFMKWVPLSRRVAMGFGLPGNWITLTRVARERVRCLNIGLASAARATVLASTREQLAGVLSAVPKGDSGPAEDFPSVIV